MKISNNNKGKLEFLSLLWDIVVFIEYLLNMFNTTNFIQNLTYTRFGVILTQFYINFSRQVHQ